MRTKKHKVSVLCIKLRLWRRHLPCKWFSLVCTRVQPQSLFFAANRCGIHCVSNVQFLWYVERTHTFCYFCWTQSIIPLPSSFVSFYEAPIWISNDDDTPNLHFVNSLWDKKKVLWSDPTAKRPVCWKGNRSVWIVCIWQRQLSSGVFDLWVVVSIYSRMNLKEPLKTGLVKRLLACCFYKYGCCHSFREFELHACKFLLSERCT